MYFHKLSFLSHFFDESKLQIAVAQDYMMTKYQNICYDYICYNSLGNKSAFCSVFFVDLNIKLFLQKDCLYFISIVYFVIL